MSHFLCEIKFTNGKQRKFFTGLSVTGEAVWNTPWQPWTTDWID